MNLICTFKSLGFCLFVYKEKPVHLTKFSKGKWYILKTVFFINDIPYLPSIWSLVSGVALRIKEQIYIFSIRRLYVISFTEVVWGIMLGPLKNSLLRFLTSNKDNSVILFFSKLIFHMKKHKILLLLPKKKNQTSKIHPQLQVVQLVHILQWDCWLLQNTKMKSGINRI